MSVFDLKQARTHAYSSRNGQVPSLSLTKACDEVERLRDEIEALTPPQTFTHEVAWGDDPGDYLADFPLPPMRCQGLFEIEDLHNKANAVCAMIDDYPKLTALEPYRCTVVMTPLTDACLYTYHLTTPYGTFVGTPVVLPYAKAECGNFVTTSMLNPEVKIYCDRPKGHDGACAGESPYAPSIIKPDMIGEVEIPLVDVGALEAARVNAAGVYVPGQRPPPLHKDPDLAKMLGEGDGD